MWCGCWEVRQGWVWKEHRWQAGRWGAIQLICKQSAIPMLRPAWHRGGWALGSTTLSPLLLLLFSSLQVRWWAARTHTHINIKITLFVSTKSNQNLLYPNAPERHTYRLSDLLKVQRHLGLDKSNPPVASWLPTRYFPVRLRTQTGRQLSGCWLLSLIRLGTCGHMHTHTHTSRAHTCACTNLNSISPEYWFQTSLEPFPLQLFLLVSCQECQ